MNLLESLRMALRSLSANKLRSSLTMLGIIIGTGAVIALLSVGQGAQQAITDQIESIGSNLIFVASGGDRTASQRQPLTREEAETLADPARVPDAAAVASSVSRFVQVTAGGETFDVSLEATTPEFEQIRNYPAELGYWFTQGQEATASRVALLGPTTAENLFDDPALALDQQIRINRVAFTVIGVLESKGGGGGPPGQDADDIVIIPLNTAYDRLFSGRYSSGRGMKVDVIYVSAVSEEAVDSVIDEVTWTLRDLHDIDYEEDDFMIVSQQDILGAMGQITSILTIFLGAIAGISLLVGGIGIMNIMLVSVTERTREIGIRKAVGAKRRDILMQFLIESVVLSIVGGLIGIGFGWAIAAIVNTLDAFATYVSPQAVILAVSFSLAVGLFFGIYPANRAANLRPIEALRYE